MTRLRKSTQQHHGRTQSDQLDRDQRLETVRCRRIHGQSRGSNKHLKKKPNKLAVQQKYFTHETVDIKPWGKHSIIFKPRKYNNAQNFIPKLNVSKNKMESKIFDQKEREIQIRRENYKTIHSLARLKAS